MKKYAKIINEETKECAVGIGTDVQFYESIGMTEMDVEQAYNGQWYISGYAPAKPAPTREEISQLREQAYVNKVDRLHTQKMRHQVLGDWTEEDEAEYEANVVRLSQEIAEQYPYPEEQQNNN